MSDRISVTTPLLGCEAERSPRQLTVDDFLLLMATIGCGMLGGLYFIFSICIMPALNRIEDQKQSIEVMNAINEAILNAYFMLVFFGTPVLCIVLAIRTFCYENSLDKVLTPLGAALLLFGEYGVTIWANVPLNNQLEAGVFNVWLEYSRPWTNWNTFRMACSIVACGCFAWALRK